MCEVIYKKPRVKNKLDGLTKECFTKEQIELLSDHTLYSNDLAKNFGVSRNTIQRWKRTLDVPLKPGRKLGVPVPSRCKPRTTYYCSGCNKKLERLPTTKQKFHFCSNDCRSISKEYSQYLSKIDRSHWTKPVVDIDRDRIRQEYNYYKNAVHRLTQKVYEQHIDIINPNRYKRTLCGVEGGYQLDHIITVRFGFDNDIPPEIISELTNLRMLPWRENLARNNQ